MKRSDISDETVCLAYAKFHEGGKCNFDARPLDNIISETGAPKKVAWAAMERAYSRGLIDCGIGIQGGWLTEKGKVMVASVASQEPPND